MGRPRCTDTLTPAEWRVLELVQLGRSNGIVAANLGLSINTIRYHVSHLLEKSERRSRSELQDWHPVTSNRHQVPLRPDAGQSFAATFRDLFRESRGRAGRRCDIGGAHLFTGRTVAQGEVVRRRGSRLTVRSELTSELAAGESIAIEGAAAIVQHLRGDEFAVNLSPLTQERTILGQLVTGEVVRLERSVRLTERVAGYPFSGLVDCVGRVVCQDGDRMTLEIDKSFRRFALANSAVALNGVGCVVLGTCPGEMIVGWPASVPGRPASGHHANVEFDALARLACDLAERAKS